MAWNRYATVLEWAHRLTPTGLYALCGGDPTVPGSAAETVLQDVTDSASDEFEGYARAARYTIPVATPTGTVPQLVRDRVLDLGVYHLHRRASSVDDRVRTDYEDAIRWCQDLVAGRVSLGVEPEPVTAPSVVDGEGGISITSSTRKFSRSLWSSF